MKRKFPLPSSIRLSTLYCSKPGESKNNLHMFQNIFNMAFLWRTLIFEFGKVNWWIFIVGVLCTLEAGCSILESKWWTLLLWSLKCVRDSRIHICSPYSAGYCVPWVVLCSSVSVLTKARRWITQECGYDFQHGVGTFLKSIESKLALRPVRGSNSRDTQYFPRGIKTHLHKFDTLSASNTEFKSAWCCTSIPSYILLRW